MDANEDVGCGAPLIHLIAVNPVGSDLATRIPTGGPPMDVPGEAGLDASPFIADERDASGFEKDLAALRAGDSGQTFAAMQFPVGQVSA